MNMMEEDSYKTKIAYNPEIDMFRGEILGLNGGADFYGKNPTELRREFKKSLKYTWKYVRKKASILRKNFQGNSI